MAIRNSCHPDNLVPGQCYFLLTYYDEALRIPRIRSLIFVGKDIFGMPQSGESEQWVFQNPESFLAYGLFDSATYATADILAVNRDLIDRIFDIERLIAYFAHAGR